MVPVAEDRDDQRQRRVVAGWTIAEDLVDEVLGSEPRVRRAHAAEEKRVDLPGLELRAGLNEGGFEFQQGRGADGGHERSMARFRARVHNPNENVGR
ncbi:MAG: hypothetical protein JNL82_28710 [Myxococcales bacterium]|nr:hypothetical protein [Myxococcales bacterium]